MSLVSLCVGCSSQVDMCNQREFEVPKMWRRMLTRFLSLRQLKFAQLDKICIVIINIQRQSSLGHNIFKQQQ